MSCDGVHALDGVQFALDSEGLIAVVDPADGLVVTRVAAEDADVDLAEIFGHVADEQSPLLRELLSDLAADAGARYFREQVNLFGVGDPLLAELFWKCTSYMHLTDIDHILVVLASAVAKVLPDDPLWLMLVSPSSSGKEEALRLIYPAGDGRLSDVSLPGLLSNRGSGGILTALQGADALVTIADFSTLLGDNKKSGENKGDVFNALREIYDGFFRRDINPTPVQWTGRLSLVAACTPAIDRFTAHGDALGTRWLYFRQADRDLETRRTMATVVGSRKGLGEKRAAAAEIATRIVEQGRARVAGVELPHSFDSVVNDAAVLVGYGRASVPRDWRREIEDIVYPEEPGRVLGQLRKLATGLLAIGLPEERALRLTRQAALSSMRQDRLKALQVVDASPVAVSTYRVALDTDMDKSVAKRALEDWQAVGVLKSETAGDETLKPSMAWQVTPEFAAIVRKVLSDG